MGDIIKTRLVRSGEGERPRRLKLYFDSGSPFTFIKRSACQTFQNVMTLPHPARFGGLGEGRFEATQVMQVEVSLLGIWCRHMAYVVPDEILETRYHVLVGHDFMRKFNIDLRPRKQDLHMEKGLLSLSLVVRGRARAVMR